MGGSHQFHKDRWVLGIFQGEVIRQCRFVLLAAEDIDRHMAETAASYKAHRLERLAQMNVVQDRIRRQDEAACEEYRANPGSEPPPLPPTDTIRPEVGDLKWSRRPAMERLWYAIQALLVASANVSKLLWGTKASAPSRQALRRSLGVSESDAASPFHYSQRTMRDRFEHFDEKLAAWAGSSNPGNFVDSNVGPPNMVVGPSATSIFRNYDPSTGVVTFQGEACDLSQLVAAARQLMEAAIVAQQTSP